HCKLVIAEGEDVISDFRFAASPGTFDAPGTDRLTSDPAVGHNAPPRRPQRWIDKLGAGFRLVHSAAALTAWDGGEVSSPEKASCKMACFASVRSSILRR